LFENLEIVESSNFETFNRLLLGGKLNGTKILNNKILEILVYLLSWLSSFLENGVPFVTGNFKL